MSLLLVFMLITAMSYAFEVQLSASVPVHFANGKEESGHIEDKTDLAAIALGMGFMFNLTERVGFGLFEDVSFGRKLFGTSPTDSDFYSLFTSDTLLAPVFNIYDSQRLKVPFGIGLHFLYFAGDHWEPNYLNSSLTSPGIYNLRKEKLFQLGLGTFLGLEYYFTQTLYMLASTTMYFDIFNHRNLEVGVGNNNVSDSWSSWGIHWGVKPTLGIGIRFYGSSQPEEAPPEEAAAEEVPPPEEEPAL